MSDEPDSQPEKGLTELPQHDATMAYDAPSVEPVQISQNKVSEKTVATVRATPAAGESPKSKRTIVSEPSQPALRGEGTVASDEMGTQVFTPGEGSQSAGVVSPGHVVLTPLAAPAGERTRYTVTKLFAEGGLGKVWLAADRDLNREVVLKELRQKQVRDPQLLRRFLKEAQVTGQLEHPNIVPVYEMGWRPSDGQPFYTMRFVRGKTLRDMIQQYHEDRKKGTVDPLALPRLLAAFVSICNALAYAHSRGVIHRDLKPANVAVGEFGEVIVLDWGLAKLVDQPDEAGPQVAVTDEAATEQTLDGEVMGTPGYMAPEQAKGDSPHTDTRTDIYGLGAILYGMIVGRPPHQGENTRELLRQIARGNVAPARSVEPSAPAALSAICERAMAPRPADRYATVSALAHDVERFLSDEPVSAYREPWWDRARRFVRKHRTQCLSTAGVAAALLVAWGLYGWWEAQRIAQLRASARSHLRLGQAALSQRALPEAKRKSSLALALVSNEPKLADLNGDAQRLFDAAEAQISELSAREGVERNLARFNKLRDQALFHGTLFTGIDVAGNVGQARAAATHALELFPLDQATGRRLADDRHVKKDEQRAILTGSYELLLVLADATAQPLPGAEAPARQADEALASLNRAARLGMNTRAWHLRQAQYLSQAGQTEGAQAALKQANETEPSTALDNFLTGDSLQREGRVAAAIVHFEQALRLEPDHFWAHYFLAVCHLKQGRPREAAAHLTASLSVKPDFGWTWLLRGYAYGELDDFIAAESDFEQASLLGVDDYGFYVNRSAVRIRAGELDEAAKDLSKAIERRQDQYQAYVNLAEIHRRNGEHDLALEQLAKAVERGGEAPTPYRVRAQVYLERNELPRALADFDLAVKHGQPGSRSLAADQVERGRILHRLKRHDEALAAYDAAAQIDPDHETLHYLRADALMALGRRDDAAAALTRYLEPKPPEPNAYRLRGFERAQRGDAAGALADYTRSLELDPDSALARAQRGWGYLNSAQLALADFEAAIKLDPSNGEFYTGRGVAHVQLGQYQQGVEDVEEGLRRAPAGKALGERISLQANAARTLAQAASRAALDQVRPDHEALATHFQSRAVELLNQALEMLPAGLRGAWLGQATADPAFDPLRHVEAFKNLIKKYPPP